VKVKDLMTKTAVSCRSEMNLASAGALLWEHDCGLLPIVDETGKVTSVITDRDICIALSTRGGPSSEITTGEVSKPSVFVCSPEDEVRAALKTMSREKIRRLPVVDDEGGLVGVLSINDIVLRAEKSEGKKPEISHDEVIRALQSICAHGPSTIHAAAA